jgi:Alginate lyase
MIPMRASRRFVAAFVVVAAIVFGTWATASGQTFQHPGVLVSRAQLDYMKIMVAAHTEPFYSAFLKAQNSDIGSLNYQPYGPPSDGFIKCGPTSNPNIGCSNSDDDSSAAYLQSLLWYITGNQQYANNAITLLNLYGHNLKGYATGSTYSNAPLQAAWDGEKWPRAAEIIRYSGAGWADADVSTFKNMLNTAILPQIINGSTSNGNWEISMIEALIGIGVFNDDPTTFNTGITYWKQRIPAYFYYHTDGAQPVPAPRGTANWYGQTVYNASVDGISQETCRDFGHAQYGISGALDAAETAHIQGIDLYNDVTSNAKNRLTAALEFNAYYLMGNPVPTSICGGTVTLQVYPTDEIGYNEYHNRLGIDLPLTLQYLQTVIRQLSNPTEYHIMVYETLSHGGDASALQPFLMRAPSNSASLRAGQSTTYTINVVPGSDPNPTVSFTVNGLPLGATPSFSPSTVTGTGASTLTITATSTTTPGVYPITVTGSDGTATFNLPLSLTVNSASADFSIVASPSSITAVAGDVANFTTIFSTANGYLGNVTLSVTGGLPAGANAIFSSAAIGSTSPTSTLSVTTLGTTAPGVYPITVSATDGSTTHSTTALLIITTLSNACIQQLGNNWINGIIPTQTGTFTAEWDATPSTALNNSNIGLSLGPQSAFTGLAIAGRFNPTGQIDARNGGAFVAASTINYVAGVKYHFRAVVNVPANTYSIYVTPAGQDEITVGTNYAFRTEQKGITSLDHWDAISQVGTVVLCNLVVDTPVTQGTVQLATTASLTQLGDGTYEATVTVKNNGTGTAQNVQLTGATLGSAAGSPLSATLGEIQPGASSIAIVLFPSSAGAPGAAAAEHYTGTYTGGSFGGSIRAALPVNK